MRGKDTKGKGMKRKIKFIAKVRAGSKLVNFKGRIFVAHNDEPVREIVGEELVGLFSGTVKAFTIKRKRKNVPGPQRRRGMKRLIIAMLCLLSISGCTIPVARTDRTAYKSEAEVKADMYDCEKSGGGGWWFAFGPWPIALAISAVELVVGAVGAHEAAAQCLEARGYKVRGE